MDPDDRVIMESLCIFVCSFEINKACFRFYWFFGLWMFRHRFDVGTMLRVFELNVKNPAFAQQKNSSNAKSFLWRTILKPISIFICPCDDYCWILCCWFSDAAVYTTTVYVYISLTSGGCQLLGHIQCLQISNLQWKLQKRKRESHYTFEPSIFQVIVRSDSHVKRNFRSSKHNTRLW